ncbi:hypothetical protein [Pseudochrobactrum lubricantis]
MSSKLTTSEMALATVAFNALVAGGWLDVVVGVGYNSCHAE